MSDANKARAHHDASARAGIEQASFHATDDRHAAA
jgi:hypothetical protein